MTTKADIPRAGPHASLTSSEDDRRAALRLTAVSRETEDRLKEFVRLLLAWQETINLIAPSTVAHLWSRHVADALQLLPLAPGARCWADLGSGGGFPGLVLACAFAERPGADIHLVESNTRKAAFLREVIRTLRIPAIVHCQRIEDFTASKAVRPDVVTARALAPLSRLFELIQPLVDEGAKALLPKGQDIDAELSTATKYWEFEADAIPSKTDPRGRILVLRTLRRRK